MLKCPEYSWELKDALRRDLGVGWAAVRSFWRVAMPSEFVLSVHFCMMQQKRRSLGLKGWEDPLLVKVHCAVLLSIELSLQSGILVHLQGLDFHSNTMLGGDHVVWLQGGMMPMTSCRVLPGPSV